MLATWAHEAGYARIERPETRYGVWYVAIFGQRDGAIVEPVGPGYSVRMPMVAR